MKQTAATVCRACQAPLAREASFCPACGALVNSRPSWESVAWWQSNQETSTPVPAYDRERSQEGGHFFDPTKRYDDDLEDTQELNRTSAVSRRHDEADAEEGRFGLGPKQLAAIVVIPILVFGVSLLGASLLLKPSTPTLEASQRPTAGGAVAAATAGAPSAAASHAPAAAPTAAGTAAPARTATPAPPGQQPTPFRLVPSPVSAVGNFTQGSGGCRGFPASWYDQFIFSTSSGTLTLKQVSTGDTSTGPVQPDGNFSVKAADGSETYTGRITGLTANANYEHLDASGCKETYVMSFRFQV